MQNIRPNLLNQASLRTLKVQLHAKGVIPFVGAGMSVPFGFMGWSAFLKETARSYSLYDQVKEMVDKQGQYEEAAELLSGQTGFTEKVQDHYGGEPRRSGALCPVELLPKLFPSGPIFTTNYDHVLEQVFANCSLPFTATLHSCGGRSIRSILELREHVLIKLHGDFSANEYRVLTLDDYRRHYGLADKCNFDGDLFLPKSLLHLFGTESVVFMGCGLNGDRYLRIMECVKPKPTHFAIIADDASNSLRESSLSLCNIRPIRYDPSDGHRLLETIIKYLHGDIELGTQASANLTVRPPVDLLEEVERYFRRHPTGLPQLSETRFFKARRFTKNDLKARLELKVQDDKVILEASPSLHVAGTFAGRDSVNLQVPGEGILNYEFLGLEVSIVQGGILSMILQDSTCQVSIQIYITTEAVS